VVDVKRVVFEFHLKNIFSTEAKRNESKANEKFSAVSSLSFNTYLVCVCVCLCV